MFLCDDSDIEFTPQPGVGAPVWRGPAPSGEVLKDFAAAKSFEYVRSDGSRQRVTLAQLLARKKGLEIGYNINDCVEIRWAAEPGTPEYATCKRHSPPEQLARMAEYRVWWASLKRPMRGQK